MPIGSLAAVRIAGAALPCLALAGLIGWAHAPKAGTQGTPSRAVERLNFTGLAQFEFNEEDWWAGPDTVTENEVRIGGWVTAPLGDSGGIRLALDGGTASRSHPGPSGTNHSSVWLSNLGGDVFLRDPNKGYVQLGYRWNRAWGEGFRDDNFVSDVVTSVHRIRYEVGLFHGDYDFEFGVEYLRLTSESTVTTLSTGNAQTDRLPSNNGYRLLGGSTWYASDAVALGLDLEWGREKAGRDSDPFPDAHFEQFQARLGADWQPPVASPRVGATIGLSVGLGYQTVPVVTSTVTSPPGGAPFQTELTLTNPYLFSYDVRVGVTLYFPGTSSLKERARQYR